MPSSDYVTREEFEQWMAEVSAQLEAKAGASRIMFDLIGQVLSREAKQDSVAAFRTALDVARSSPIMMSDDESRVHELLTEELGLMLDQFSPPAL